MSSLNTAVLCKLPHATHCTASFFSGRRLFTFFLMDRLKVVLQYFQSNSESISNGICVLLALVAVKLYTSFDFNCPCLPQYNKMYALGVMFVPPVILFLLGILVNRHTGVMMEELARPTGRRAKNPAVVK